MGQSGYDTAGTAYGNVQLYLVANAKHAANPGVFGKFGFIFKGFDDKVGAEALRYKNTLRGEGLQFA